MEEPITKGVIVCLEVGDLALALSQLVVAGRFEQRWCDGSKGAP